MVFGMIFDNMTQKPLCSVHFGVFWPNSYRNSIVMARTKVSSDQKLFETVCYILKVKVTKFHFSGSNGF